MPKTVVIIDDSKFLVKQIAEFFEKEMGFEVVASGTDGNDAVDLYIQHKPDLITLDITMPNKDGETALKEIIGQDPAARVLMISAVRGDAMLNCMDIGAKDYVEKPLKFTSEEFRKDFKDSINEAFGD